MPSAHPRGSPDVCNAREHGLAGDGHANDQPALAALVEALGEAVARDGRPRLIWCPPGTYLLQDATTTWRSGVSLVGAGVGIGGWGPIERLSLNDCIATDNATNGIFVELQKGKWPPPRGIKITGGHCLGNRFGISDWGADGLIVSACLMCGNLEVGFDVSAQGVSGVGGTGGLLAGCLIDGNRRDGVSIGNTEGRYAVRGNRISNNGRHGYHQHNTQQRPEPAREMAIDGNDLWGNGHDGIHVDAPLLDASIVNNRIRNNGRRAEGGAAGIAIAAPVTGAWIRGNRIWQPGTEGRPICDVQIATGCAGTGCRIEDNGP